MNALLGNVGTTVRYLEPVLAQGPRGPAALGELVRDMDDGEVNTLIIGAFDPVYSAPVDLDFRSKMTKVDATVYHGLYRDNTAAAATWFVPAAHDLESWGDARGPDGTTTLQQPLIEPLFGGVTLSQVMVGLLGEGGKDAQRVLREFWESRRGEQDFERFWRDALQRGVIDGTKAAVIGVKVAWEGIATALETRNARSAGLELNFFPHLAVHDGRFAYNAWLLELPDPMTKITWDNAVLVSPATAARLGASTGTMVELELRGRTVKGPVMVLPMQADDTACVALGYGRPLPSDSDANVGFDAFAMRTSESPWFTPGVVVRTTAEHHGFASAQPHASQEDRPLALQTTIQRLRSGLDPFREHKGKQPTMYSAYRSDGYRWGMAIDLTRCIGCAACVVACEAENNSPVVGRHEIANGRSMQWLRIDRYFIGAGPTTEAITQPVMCVHCEDAPCEYVCPVNATVHSAEGLNQMVYNRCVGTRFCSNNCPYKVRRFNYLAYQKNVGEVQAMRMNPDVTVRSRGVMEKCTYCVQRIERARIAAEIEGRPIRDGEIVTACAQACPTRAITFGSLGDGDAEVTRLHHDERAYFLLHELGTRPRTAHLGRLRNPNPELA
jgi:molybdopterin-containing oxidoreductase family iron-sulfur binding subunit